MRRDGQQASAEDRELGLHDETIQALFGIGLKLEYCADVVDSSPDQVKQALEGIILSLNDLIEDLRGRIYEIN